jgi:hypothetical protein
MDIKFELSQLADEIFSKEYIHTNTEIVNESISEDETLETVLESIEITHKKTSKKTPKIIPEVRKEIVEDFELSSLDESVEDVQVIDENSSLDFIGSFTLAPNPLEQKKNALYKNLNEQKIYIRNQEGLWESFLENGKQGAAGQKGSPGGGTGVAEVQRIATEIATIIAVSAMGTVSGTGGSVSGNYLSTSGGTLTGTLNTPAISSVNLSANDVIVSKNNATPLLYTNSLIDAVQNVNSYTQTTIQNQSSGTSASSDIVATSDTGTDSSNYVDFGINGSGYSVPSWTVNGANDGYVYAQGGNLSIGTSTSAKNINLFVGGTLSANVVANITSSGISAISHVGIITPTTTINLVSATTGSLNIPLSNITSAVDGSVFRLSNGDFAKSLRGQTLIDGGILYEKAISNIFPTGISATGLTILDLGTSTTYSRGGLKDTIRAGFWDLYTRLKGEVTMNVDVPVMSAHKFWIEVLVPGKVLARGFVDPTLIPSYPTSASARTVVFNFDLFADGTITTMSAATMKSIATTVFGTGLTAGSGTSAANSAYTFTNELANTVDWTIDQVMSVRVNIPIAGPTIRPYAMKIWV